MMTMVSKNKKQGVALVLGLAVFYLVKYGGPLAVEHLFNQRNFSLLNLLTRAQGQQSLGFYLGGIEQFLLGPVSLVLAGWVFLAGAARFLRGANPNIFGLAVLGFLILTRPEVLLYPVYGGDAIIGPWSEGIWLARNHFDYLALAKEPGFTFGGPKTYLFSIYPGFLALSMALTPSAKVCLFINHLLTFAMAAVMIALFREVLRRIYDEGTALLGSLVLLSFPLMQSQLEMINMEMPCLFFAFLSAYFLFRQKFMLAAVMSVVSALVKKTGAISCIAVFVVCSICFLLVPKYRYRWSVLATGGLALVAGAGIVLLSMHVVGHVGVFKLYSFRIVSDVLFAFFVVGTLLGLIRLALSWKMGWTLGPGEVQNLKYSAWGIFWLYAVLWFLLFTVFTDLAPRYKLLTYPFLFFVLFFFFF